jgi:hypothetical protein
MHAHQTLAGVQQPTITVDPSGIASGAVGGRSGGY